MAKTNGDLLRKLNELEPLIKGEARQCPNFVGLQTRDDLEQIGRLELLQVLTEKGCDLETGYYRMAIRYAMTQAATAKYNKKRLVGSSATAKSFDDDNWLSRFSVGAHTSEDSVRSEYVREMVQRLEKETEGNSIDMQRPRFEQLVAVLINDTYNYSRTQAGVVITHEWIKQHGLERVYVKFFNGRVEALLDCAFADDGLEEARQKYRQKELEFEPAIMELKGGKNYGYIKQLQLLSDPKSAVRTLLHRIITQVFKYTPQKAIEVIDYDWFVTHGLGKLLWVFYRNSPYAALIDVFGDEMENPYIIAKLPQRFWSGEGGEQRADLALRWFLSKRGVTDKSQCQQIGVRDFEAAGLGTMLQIFFRGSPYLAMKTVFSDLKSWETKRAAGGSYATDMQRLEALDAYLLAKLGTYIQTLSAEDVYRLGIRSVVGRSSLEDFGLRGLLARYDNQPYKLFRTHYSSQILPWSLERKGQFNEQDPKAYAKAALQWLFEKYLLLDPKELPGVLSYVLLCHLGFSGLISNPKIGLNCSTFAVANLVYPGRFQPKDFPRGRGRDGKLSYHLLDASLDMRKGKKKI